jgi:S1-C subfamily serine protease
MSRISLRCLAALAIFFCLPQVRADEARWTADFPDASRTVSSAAFVVGDGRHVVSVALSGMTAEKGKVFSDRRLLPAELFLDPVSRLVVFRLNGPPGKAMALAPATAWVRGATVRVSGGGSGTCAGWEKRYEGKILPLALLKIDYSGTPPMPGTPLTDPSGRVVAVAHQPTGNRSGYAISADVVKRVVEDIQRSGRVAQGWIGLHLMPQVSVPRITRVQEGSPAAAAGVKAGDVLVEIGGRRTADYADAVNAFYFLRPGTTTPVRIKRGDRDVELSIVPVERRP